MNKKIFLRTILELMLLINMLACGKSKEMATIDSILYQVEYLMEDKPDSSLIILNEIDTLMLKDRSVKARYALLKSMALDKNYIDTTTFDVLQPAMDYYLKNGTADEKMRTYYYQSVLYKNRNEDDKAMQTILEALDFAGEIHDSLTLARLIVAQGTLYFKQYRISDFIHNNLRAAKIYESEGNTFQVLKCYAKAINGTIILGDKHKADSIVKLCRKMIKNEQNLDKRISRSLLAYAVEFGNQEQIKNELVNFNDDIITLRLLHR